MENAIVNTNEIKKSTEEGPGEEIFLVPQMLLVFRKINPQYPVDKEADYLALLGIATKIKLWEKHPGDLVDNSEHILKRWGELCTHIRADGHLSKYSLTQIIKHFQSVIQSFNNGQHNGTTKQNNSHKPVITGTIARAGKI